MKEFHPAAAAINRSGQRTRYLLKDTEGIAKLSAPSSRPTCVLNEAEFGEYVKANRVQMFQDTGDGPHVLYTDEEAKVFGKIAKKSHVGPSFDDDTYWKSEVIFYDEAIDITGGVSIGVVALRKMALVGLLIAQGCVYSKGMSKDVAQLVAKHSIVHVSMAPDLIMCNWDVTQLENMLQLLHNTPTTLCTSTLQNLDSAISQSKMTGFLPATPEDIQKVVRLLEFAQPPVPQVQSHNNVGQMHLT